MASVSTRSFNDPDEYFSGIRAMKGSGFLSSERGVFGAELTHVNFSRLWIQSGSETLARSGHITVDRDRRPIAFLTEESTRPIVVSGEEMPTEHIAFYSPGATEYQITSGSFR